MQKPTVRPFRQRQIAELVASGRTLDEVAAELGIRRHTVGAHRYVMLRSGRGGDALSPRQREIVALLAKDLSLEQVARTLGIAKGTASFHRRLAMEVLGVHTVVGLTHYAIVRGWVQPGDGLDGEQLADARREEH